MKTNSSNCVEVLTHRYPVKESIRMQRPPDQSPQDQSSDPRFQFLTTDDVMFSKEAEVLKIAFGPTCVSLSRAAAEDLSYRLCSFLTYLDHIETAFETTSEATPETTLCCDCETSDEKASPSVSQTSNVIPLRKNER